MDCTKYKDIEICLIAHASFKIKTKGKVIYIDAYAGGEENYKEKANLVLITHEHYDHCDESKLNLICDENTTIIAAQGCEDKIKGVKGKKIFVKEGEELEAEGIKVKAVPAYNLNKPYHPRGLGVGYILDINGIKIYHTGDTDFIPEMRRLEREGIDVVLLPISGTYVMDENEAYELALEIKPKLVIPMHYNYLKGLEKDPREFKEKLENKGIRCEVLI